MGNEVAKPISFEEKMKERIKESIGELITDEELSVLLKRSLEEVFFKPIKIPNPRGGYYDPPIDGPSLLHGIIKELLGEQVRKSVDQHIKEHSTEVFEVMQKVLCEGVGMAVVNAIANKFSSDLSNFTCQLQQSLTSRTP